MQKLNWRQIEIFHAIMTHGNITQAAKALFTSQPTLSRELARLERQLTLPLFKRVSGRLQPTKEGLLFFEEVQRSWYGLQRIQAVAQGLKNFEQDTLSIVCLPVFSQSLLPKLAQSFLQTYPQVKLKVMTQESPMLEEWLSAQRFDLGLTETQQNIVSTEPVTLLSVDEVCVLPENHPLASKSVLTPEDFQQQAFISLGSEDSYRIELDNLFQRLSIERQLRIETQSAASVCAMVCAGLGISIVNPLSALDWVEKGLVMRPFSHKIPFVVSVIKPQHRPSSTLLTVFMQHLQLQATSITQKITSTLTS